MVIFLRDYPSIYYIYELLICIYFVDLVLPSASENMEGKSTGYIFVESSLAGVFNLTDSCRTGAKEALKELKSMGIETAMLTGDCQAAANHAQNEVKLKFKPHLFKIKDFVVILSLIL